MIVLGLLFVCLDYFVSIPVGDPPRPRMYGSTHGYLVVGVLNLLIGSAVLTVDILTKRFLTKRNMRAASKEGTDS